MNLYFRQLKQITQIHSALRSNTTIQIQAIRSEMDGYKAELQTLKVPAQTEIDRATEIAKIEAFDQLVKQTNRYKRRNYHQTKVRENHRQD